MALSTRVDNILVLLYAPGPGGEVNTPFSSLGKLHLAVHELQQEGRFWLPRGRPIRYVYVQNEFGLFSADFLDDFFSLHALGCLSLEASPDTDPLPDSMELRRYFHELAHGELLLKELEFTGRSTVSLSASTGLRLGALLFDALSPEDAAYLTEMRSRSLGDPVLSTTTRKLDGVSPAVST